MAHCEVAATASSAERAAALAELAARAEVDDLARDLAADHLVRVVPRAGEAAVLRSA